jgi:hypothetical protein
MDRCEPPLGGGPEYREHRVSSHVDDATMVGLDLRSKPRWRRIHRGCGCTIVDRQRE